MKRIASCGMGLLVVLAIATVSAAAQNQVAPKTDSASSGQSLGEYARHVRKAPESTAKPKVFDNDNLPKTEHLSIVGKVHRPGSEETPSETQGESTTPAAGEEKTEAKPDAATQDKTTANKAPEDAATRENAWKQWADKIQAQRQQIDLLSRELDVLQREYQLRAAAMYADAGNRLRNQADWDKQDAQYKQQIADKQKAVDDAKQKLEDLQEEARRAGAPSSVRE